MIVMRIFIDMNHLILIITIFINLGLGAFVFLKDRKNEINKTFGIVLFFIAFWTFSFLMFTSVRSPEWILFWRKITPIGSALVAGYFLYFSLIFPNKKRNFSALQKILIVLPGYMFASVSIFTPLIIRSFETINYRTLHFWGIPDFGPLYGIYALYLLAYFFGAHVHLFFKHMRATGREKLQIFYVLIGMGLAVSGGIILSLLLPLFGVFRLFTLGPTCSLMMIGFIVYAMVKHRLLNVENFVFRGLSFLFVTAAFVIILTSVIIGDFNIFIYFSLLLIQLAFGVYILFYNVKSEINFSFAAFCFSLSFWTFAVFRLMSAKQVSEIVFWGRYIHIGPILVIFFFLWFTFVFPKKIISGFKFGKVLLFIPPLILLAMVPGPWILKSAILTTDGPRPIYGTGYPFFIAYFLIYFIFGIFNLIRKHNRTRGGEKNQIRYVFLGLFLSFLFGIITNLILPTFGVARFFSIGPFFTLFLIAFSAYAIVKHRLMSIEVVIQRSTVYAVATVLIMALYALAVIISESFLRNILGYTSLFVSAAAALLIAVLYQPLVKSFQSLTDRIFFRGRYNYQTTLKEISQRIASVMKLEELGHLIVSSFIITMRVSEISFLLLEKEKKHFRSIPLNLARYKEMEIDGESPIVSLLSSAKEIIVKDEIEDKIARLAASGRDSELESLKEAHDEMERLGIPLWIPIISKDELIGIIALGQKLSGDIFTAEDMGLLSTLASQVAVALDNARLYDEVVNMKDYSEKILQSMINGMLTVDNRGKIVTCNSMCERITGRKEDELLGKSCEEVWGKRGMVTNIIENTLNLGKSYVNFEARLASPERGFVPVSFSSTVLLDHLGKKMGVLLSIQDLSEVKELEGKVRQADKLGALATMAAGMAHEIKNPLSSMKVLSQLLPKKINDAGYRMKLSEIMPREINRIDRIVESLLGFARATALKFEITDLKEILEDNLKYFESQAKEEEINITRIYEQLPLVEVDKEQISQVFSNLILNALQAMPDGGELKIEAFAGKTVEGIIREVKIRVSDTGYGISEDMVKKLFDPFFTTKYGGTGLGLTITHSIVDAHKGYIDVVSKIGKGTSFTITLPVSQGLV
jgi:PAS domain S-box-containing protein